MSIGDLAFDILTSVSFKWSIPDLFRLATRSGCSLQSPDFSFADGRYGLRLFETVHWGLDYIRIELLSLTDPDPGIAVLYEVQVKSGTGEKDMYRDIRDNRVGFWFPRNPVERERDLYVPDGTLTLLCSVRQSVGGTPNSGGDRTRVISPHRMTNVELSSVSTPSLYVTWTIPGFFRVVRESTHTLDSPEFRFSGRRHHLRLVPSEYSVEIRLLNWSDSDPGRYEVGLKSTAGEEIHIHRVTSTTRYFFIYRDELDLKESDCFPEGHLTIFCRVESSEPSSEESPMSGAAETPRSKDPVPRAAARTKSVGVQTSNEEGVEEGLPETSNSVSCAVQTEILDSVSCAVQTEVSDSVTNNETLRNEDCSALDPKDLTLLSERLANLLKKGSDYDLTICVQNKEFRAHRAILSSRSPVFAMMLSHDTKESNTGTISVEDCDPESFDQFLLYVYSGRTANLTPRNALHLYYTADKYDFPALKERCVRVLKTSLTVTSICDVVLLAAKHQERELLEVATEFFARNVEEILVTVQWQTFMIQNPVEANELYIKGLKILVPRK